MRCGVVVEGWMVVGFGCCVCMVVVVLISNRACVFIPVRVPDLLLKNICSTKYFTNFFHKYLLRLGECVHKFTNIHVILHFG